MNCTLFLLIASIIIVAGCIDATGQARDQSGYTHLQPSSVENGTAIPESAMIYGKWYQTGRGNGARIWYDFHPDGSFTFNYDMKGNRDTVISKGRWTFLENFTFRLDSDISQEPDTHGNENITLSSDGRSFHSGTEYLSASAGKAIIFERG